MNKIIYWGTILGLAISLPANIVFAADMSSRTSELQLEVKQLEQTYQSQTEALQKRLDTVEKKANNAARQARRASKPPRRVNAFNPAISLILNGAMVSYSLNPDSYRLPGFALGPEAGLEIEGLSLGESEITLAANTDQYWRGQMTVSLGNDNGETVTEVEEAFIETLGLGNGLTIRAGRFFSGMGYLNGKHAHAWNFSDAPLVYRGLFGDQLKQEGLRATWLLPTDRYMEIGLEAGNGRAFPAGGSHSGIGDWVAYLRTGGDIGDSHSWQAGLSHFRADDISGREATTHLFSGDSHITGLDLVYKWSPHGNSQDHSLVLQAEVFRRDESGDITVDNADQTTFDGRQTGWYTEAIYKLQRQWRAGLRYDQLSSNNRGSNRAVLEAAGLLEADHHPHRSSAMLEWSPSEFSRIRLQYNRDDSTQESDDQVFLQYTQALGSHGAHSY